MYDLKRYFLLDPSVIFLNHGSFGATPRPVFAEYQRWQRELERQPVEFLDRRAADLLGDSRSVLGEYLGTTWDDLVYVTNATVAVNIVARSLNLGPGDQVLTSDHEYGACDRTWRFLARTREFVYKVQPFPVPLTTSQDIIEQLWQGVTEDTRVIFLSHITSPTALIFPVAEICRRARQQGILTLIDGAHAPGQIPLNLEEVKPDFYAGNLHKWLCAPKGAGFLYARPEVQGVLEPLVVSWGWESDKPNSSDFVAQQEGWGTRDLAAFLSVPAAIGFQQEHDWERIRETCHEMLRGFLAELSRKTGQPPLHPDGPGWYRQMVSIPLPRDTDAIDLKGRLYNEYRIEVPVFEWNGIKLIRVSMQGYNSLADLERLIGALSELL